MKLMPVQDILTDYEDESHVIIPVSYLDVTFFYFVALQSIECIGFRIFIIALYTFQSVYINARFVLYKKPVYP